MPPLIIGIAEISETYKKESMTKQKAAPDVEHYLNRGSDHDNKHALDVWLDAIKSDTFPDPVTPLKTFVELRRELVEIYDRPAQIIPLFEQRTEGMDNKQKAFIARHLEHHFRHTVYTLDGTEEIYLKDVAKTLDACLSRWSREAGTTTQNPNTGDLRRLLKETIRQEIERLPEYLQSLEPKDRVNVLCKIMPYVFPKVEAVHLSEGEPFSLS
jgi:hypothetical protein